MNLPLILYLKSGLRFLRRTLHLSPMQKVLRGLASRGVILDQLDALECFAFDGTMHTLDYGRKVRSLTTWEINEVHVPTLRSSFPRATIQTVDSYQQVKVEDRKFDLIIVDNSPKDGQHWEHFDLFPEIYDLANDTCIFVLTVIPEINQSFAGWYPKSVSSESFRARSEFYDFPLSTKSAVSPDRMTHAYEEKAKGKGFLLADSFYVPRNRWIGYLTLIIRKSPSQLPHHQSALV